MPGCAHYIGDEFRINKFRELNNCIVSKRLCMDCHTGRNPVESVSTDEVSAPDLIDGRMPTIDFFPADIVRHRTARWRGVRAETKQIINHEALEYRFRQQYHLIIAVEQGVCYDRCAFALSPFGPNQLAKNVKRP